MKGRLLIPFSGNDSYGRGNHLYGLKNLKGEIVVELKYETVRDFHNGVAVVENNGTLNGCIDLNGNEFISTKYWKLGQYSCGLIRYRKERYPERYGFLDREGEVVISDKFVKANDFSENMASVAVKGVLGKKKYGFIDTKGKWIIKARYEWAGSFNEGLASVKANGLIGAIDIEGKVRVPMKYSKMSQFKNGLAAAEKNGKCGVIDKNNSIVLPFVYDILYPTEGDFYIFRENESNKLGVIDIMGKVILAPKYDDVIQKRSGYPIYYGRINDKYILFNDNFEPKTELNLTYSDIEAKTDFILHQIMYKAK